MTSNLDVTVALDSGTGTTTFTPTRELTVSNVRGLLPVARRAAPLAPAFCLIVDLGELTAADPQAVQLLTTAGPQGTCFLRADIPGIGTKKSRVRQHPGIPNVTAPQGGHGVSAYRPPEARLTGLRTLLGTLAVLLLSAVTWNHLSGTASMNRG